MHSVKATAALISCLHTGKHFACDLQLTCNWCWSRLRTSKQQAGLMHTCTEEHIKWLTSSPSGWSVKRLTQPSGST